MDIVFQIITPLISLSSVLISYFLGRWSKSKDAKKESDIERYKKYYVPLFSMLVRFGYPKTTTYQILMLHQLKVIDFMESNIIHMSLEEASLFKDIYYLSLRSIEFATGNYPENQHYIEDLERVFENFISISEQKATTIAARLRLEPTITKLL